MTAEQRRQRVEHTCAELVAEGAAVTFDQVAARTGIGRATLYRNPDLRALVTEQRLRRAEAHTLPALAHDIAHLRTAIDALAAKVRGHEEQLRASRDRRR